MGLNSCIAGLAITNPNPHKQGTNKAIKISLKGMKFCYELSFEFNIL